MKSKILQLICFSSLIACAQLTIAKDTNTNQYQNTNTTDTSQSGDRTQQQFSDITITAKVKSLFIGKKIFHNTDLSPLSVNVETKNGVVYLTGKADSQIQIDNAKQIAQSVNGVKQVVSHVQIVKPQQDTSQQSTQQQNT